MAQGLARIALQGFHRKTEQARTRRKTAVPSCRVSHCRDSNPEHKREAVALGKCSALAISISPGGSLLWVT
jgi:hypothetical protein